MYLEENYLSFISKGIKVFLFNYIEKTTEWSAASICLIYTNEVFLRHLLNFLHGATICSTNVALPVFADKL